MKELKRIKKPINPVNNAIKTSYEKFNAKREEVKNDPVGTFANATTHKLTKEQEDRIKLNNQAKNNTLD